MMEVRTPDLGDPELYVCAECEGVTFAQKYADNLEAFYAFTLAPNPKLYPSDDPSEQYNVVLNSIFFKTDLTKVFSVFLFTPELTENGNIHIHGYYSVSDLVKYYKWFIPACKSIGFVMIKKKVDNEWTEVYVCKDMNKMEDILSREQPIPLHTFNYITYREEYGKMKTKGHFTKLNLTFTKKKKYNITKYF